MTPTPLEKPLAELHKRLSRALPGPSRRPNLDVPPTSGGSAPPTRAPRIGRPAQGTRPGTLRLLPFERGPEDALAAGDSWAAVPGRNGAAVELTGAPAGVGTGVRAAARAAAGPGGRGGSAGGDPRSVPPVSYPEAGYGPEEWRALQPQPVALSLSPGGSRPRLLGIPPESGCNAESTVCSSAEPPEICTRLWEET